VDFVNIVNYKIYMDKNKNNTENSSYITSDQELQEHKSRGIYLRDDHCDWGSSGMNEFTKEYSDKD
tara:strand:+ start:449 stop:646 length:198 start_codon:yes stop_codon:yes gene_type:complete